MSDQELKKSGLKVTTQRLRILEILEKDRTGHLKAEDIYSKLKEHSHDASLATVYRVLISFEEVGLIKKHNFSDGHAVFELNKGEHHDHLVCNGCGKIEEFFDKIIELKQEEIAKKHSFRMDEHTLIIYGLCQNCQNK
tara:strand:- start:15354 stop:15767 length:414 start_codon:yes stop_codon:yes gene_type:complete